MGILLNLAFIVLMLVVAYITTFNIEARKYPVEVFAVFCVLELGVFLMWIILH